MLERREEYKRKRKTHWEKSEEKARIHWRE
jgi:hypothetical protein